MFELFFGFSQAMLVVLFQVWLPGIFLCLLLCCKAKWTFTDAFLLGLLWNVFIGLCVVPFVNDTFTLSIAIKIASIALIVIGVLSRFLKKNDDKDGFNAVFFRSFSKNHVIIAAGVSVVVMSFVATHNLGFDDIAHLKYLNGVMDGEPYPVFRLLVGEWESARYPFFGVLIGSLGHQIIGGALFLYYVLGLMIFIAFMLKIYEFSLAGSLTKSFSFVIVLLVASALMLAGIDNYFNYGLYPLQQSKLLFILGLLYIFIGWGLQRSQEYFFIGSGLLVFAVLYHLNLVLLYVTVLPFVLIYIVIRSNSRRQWLLFSLFFVLFPLLTVPAALSPERGFLHFEQPPAKVSEGKGGVVKKEKLSQFELLILKAKRMLSWVKKGRYKNEYFQRVFSLDVILIPLLLILVLQTNLLTKFGVLMVVISLLICVQQIVTVMPKQFLASMFRSGTLWMLYDVANAKLAFRHVKGEIITDPYTGVFLKALGVSNVRALEDQQNVLAFSPQFSTAGRQYVASQLSLTKRDYFLFNGRYWGVRAVDQWRGKNSNSLRFFNSNLDDFYAKGNIQRLGSMARRGFDYVKLQISMPMLMVAAEPKPEHVSYQNLLDAVPKQDSDVYRHTALVNLSNLRSGDKVQLEFKGKGDISYMNSLSKNVEEIVLAKRTKGNIKTFDVIENIPHTTLFFKMDLGHLGELGSMESVSIVINDDRM